MPMPSGTGTGEEEAVTWRQAGEALAAAAHAAAALARDARAAIMRMGATTDAASIGADVLVSLGELAAFAGEIRAELGRAAAIPVALQAVADEFYERGQQATADQAAAWLPGRRYLQVVPAPGAAAAGAFGLSRPAASVAAADQFTRARKAPP